MPAIHWLPWSGAAFERARVERKPVLLAIAAAWCRFCEEMHRTSYADPAVVALVNDRFVAVRVDADRRPDISQRYGLGGWPTTAFLTPDGRILGGGTFVPRDRLVAILERVAEAFAAGRHQAPLPSAAAEAEPAVATVDQLVEQVRLAFDPAHGGFGVSPKFPHAAPIRLAIDIYKDTGSDQARDMAVRSLDAMGWGPLYDERDGGFFRSSLDADWGRPNEEKLLDVNASMLSLYLGAFEDLELGRYGERADDILRYVQTWLADPVDGGWGASQRADPGYSSRPAADAAASSAAPPVDRTLFADWNASMVSAALQAGRVLGDPGLSEFAIRSFERVVLLCYKPGAGVAHYFDAAAAGGIRGIRGATAQAEVRGLLDDQVAMAVASLDAFEATGNIVYEMLAEELALYAIRAMWDGRGGGFFDRDAEHPDDIGLLAEPLKPFVTNCLAARLLQRLARLSKSKHDFAGHASRVLAAVAPRAAAAGPLAAEYVLAVRGAGQ